MECFRAVVIGGGTIGSRMDRPGDRPAQTHAGVYWNHKGFELSAICDPLPSKDLEKWGVPIYQDLDHLLGEMNFDVATVCVPPHFQPQILKKLANTNVKAVVAEKPLATTAEETAEIVSLYRKKNIPLFVNFSRRYLAFYQKLAADLASQNLLCVSLKYSKGLRHNGSHGLDILRLLFGEVKEARLLFRYVDYSEDDPTYGLFLEYEKCPQVYFQALDQNAFTLFELDIISASNRYVITKDHKSCYFYEVNEACGVPPGKRLVQTLIYETKHEDALQCLVANLYDVLTKQAKPLCDGENALYVSRLLERLQSLEK